MIAYKWGLLLTLLAWVGGCRHVGERDPQKKVKPATEEGVNGPMDRGKDHWRACAAVRITKATKASPLLDAPQNNGTVLRNLAEDEILQIVDLLQDETGQLWLRVSGEDAPPPGWLSARGHECATPSDEPPAGQVKTCGQVTEPFRFAWPVPDYPSIERTYGVAVDYQDCGFHTGIDIAAPTGKPIVAVAQGKVVHVGPMWFDRAGAGRGPYAVIIEHQPGKMYSTYGHNSRALVSLGQCVAKGQVIAEIGSLGHSTGPHLHFEMVMNRPFSGNWRVPFHDVCVKKTPFAPQSAYRSPDPQALTYDP